jgi:4-hydroxy-2-oxoglutarate aldolase
VAGLDLEGVLVPLVTPFDEDGEVDWAALERDLQGLGGAPLAGYVALGSTSEFPHLSRGEKERVVAAVVEGAGGRAVIAQTGEPTTRETVAFTRRAAELGAQAALVVSPSYYKGSMREREIERFYMAVAEGSPLPVLIYNIPQNTGTNLPVPLVARLAEHENVVGIKDSSGILPQIADLCASTPEGWRVFTGSAPIFLGALVYGAHGGILAAANPLPYEFCDIHRRFSAGDLAGAQEVHRRLGPAVRALGRFGIPGYKAAMDMLGLAGGYPREPLLPLEDAEREQLLDALRASSLVRY